jgi:hypothetical protein
MVNNFLQTALAPTGTLRVGINYGNPVLAKRDLTSGNSVEWRWSWRASWLGILRFPSVSSLRVGRKNVRGGKT